ncbi:MAG: T9SS type A sorting domain-containing protein [Calditrichaceae bacterium]|nr:T9SS type A sorting domain-containing protein [Calditrichaceae bacterium]MBN2709208.1 T9SS type A sorting domain-containing protein [Calditrichaceae bacterium]
MKTLNIALLFILIQLIYVFAQDTFTLNTTSGDWNTGSHWTITRDGDNPGSNTYPGESSVNQSSDGADIVVIPTGTDVTLDADVPAAVGSVTVNGTGSLAIASYALSSGGDVSGTGTISMTTGTLTVGGDWSVTTFNRGTSSTVTFNGSGAQTIGTGNEFYNIVINKSAGTILIDNNIDVVNAMTLSSGSVEISSSNEVLFSASGTVLDITGGNFTSNSLGSLNFYQTATLQSSVSSTNLPGLIFKSIVSNTLTLTAVGGAVTFTVNGNVERGGRHSLSLSSSPAATLAYATGLKLTYSASNSAMTVGLEWPAANGPDNVTNASSVNVTLSADRTIPSTGIFVLNQSGGNFVVGSGVTLTINGTLQRQTIGTVGITIDGSLVYGSSGSKLEFYTNAGDVIIGPEWPTGTSNLPQDVEINLNPSYQLTGSSDYYVSRDLYFYVGVVSLGSNTLTVSGNVFGSEISGSATISDNTTLQIGSGSGTSYSQKIKGTLTLNKFVVNKTGGANDDSNTVSLEGLGGLTFTNNSSLTIAAGIFNINGNTIEATGASNSLTVETNGKLRTGGTSLGGFETMTLTSGTVIFDGDTEENIPVASYGTLVINNPNGGLISSGTTTVSTNLTLTDGVITSSSTNLLRLGTSATISGGLDSSYVSGPLQIVINDANAHTFPVGSTGRYRPAVFDYDSFTGGSNEIVQIQYIPENPGGTEPSGIFDISSYGYYTMQSVSGTPPTSRTHSLTLRYTGTAYNPETRTRILVQNGSGPVFTVPASQSQNETNDDVTATGITAFPTVNYILAFGAAGATIVWDGGGSDDNWSTAANWTGDAVPQTGDVVSFTGSYGSGTDAAIYDASVTQDEFTSIILNPAGGTISLTLTKTALDLTDDATCLTAGNNSTLIYNGTNLNMDAGAYNASRTDMQTGSTVQYNTGNIHEDTFYNLIINGAASTVGSNAIQVNGDLTKNSSTAFSTSAPFTVAGNYTNTLGNATYDGGLTVNGASATFLVASGAVGGLVNISCPTITVNSGSFGGTVTFSGANAQSLGGSVSASFSSLTINKSANNLTVGANGASVSGTLTLTNGLISIPSGVFTLGSGATVSGGGSESSYVQGAMSKVGATGTVLFPIGAGHYRPVETSLTGSSPTVQFQVFDTAPNNSFDDPPIIKISEIRYWLGSVTSGSITGGQVTLGYGSDDGVTNFDEEGDVVVARSSDNSSDPYSDLGGEASGTTPTGTVTSTLGVGTSLGYFTLGTITGDNSLPVELISFEAQPEFGKVSLAWTTASEINNLGFNIYRKGIEEESWKQVNDALIPGAGSVSYESGYIFVDKSVIGGLTYEYLLESMSLDGSRSEDMTIEVAVPLPDHFVLFNNYPNPFNPVTHIKFQLPEASDIKLVIYNVQGEKVKTLVAGREYPAGEHMMSWDASDETGRRVASGMYLYRFEAGRFAKTGKMILLK